MTDKELLELAAKAIGLETYAVMRADWLNGCSTYWNPLVDDADAFRLASTLNLYINCDMVLVGHPKLTKGIEFDGYPEKDKYAATRRAIVREAAEIGKETA